ncbi:MAG: HAD family hydrolase [Anaerolineaceae bacterium]
MPIDLSIIRAICFDVDGTLSDTDNAWVNRLSAALHGVRFLFKHHDPTSFARWLMLTGESPANAVYHLLDRLSLDDNAAALYEKLIRRRKSAPRAFLLMAHARETLETLVARYPMSVVSARNEKSTWDFLQQFTLGWYFKAVVTSQTCEHTKPYPDPILYAARMMNVDPRGVLMVGDTTVDILAGKAAGAQTIGVLCGFGSEKELRKAGADLVLQDLGELQRLFAAETGIQPDAV